MLRLFVAALALLLISDHVARSESGRRVALVVGVSNYKYVPRLGNPTNDALDISNVFYRLGFQVQTLIDPDRNGLEEAIRKLGHDAEGAEAGVFYYSGHALEVNGQNLLVPASANIRSERDLRFETVDLDSVLDSVSGRGKVSLLILDSCRDNPFIQQLAGSSRAVGLRGMGPIDAAVGTLIAFSTAPGKTASDGDNRNSPFTAALLHNIERPGVEVRRLLGDVRREVRLATGGTQIPWENSALEGEFFFKPPAPVVAAAPPSPPAPPPLQEPMKLAFQKVIPDINPQILQDATRTYVEAKGSKAQAVSREKNLTWRSDARESAYSAEQSALEGCQIRYGSPCILIAVNEAIAELPSDSGSAGRAMSRVTYDGLFDVIQIPALRPEWRWRDDVINYLSKPGPKAAAIHPWGRIFTSFGAPDQRSAEADALKKCNDDPSRANRDGPCFLYTINNHVVLPLKITGPRPPAKTVLEAVQLVAPARIEEVYRSARLSKALAVEPDSGNWTYWDGDSSNDNAERNALGHCQVNANKPCILIAKGDALITSDPTEAPRRDIDEVHSAGLFRIDKLPFRPGASLDVIRNYDLLPQPKAMAVKTVPPRYISATGPTLHDAEQKALSGCNSISGRRCMLYSVNDSIVLPQRKTEADP
jgi:hypothetical protein